MSMRFAGKVAIVTGASTGIGLAGGLQQGDALTRMKEVMPPR